MTDKTPMPVSGDPDSKGDADGVNINHPSGRVTLGESGGGAHRTRRPAVA